MLCKCFTNASQSRHVKLCQTSCLSKEWWNLCKTMQNEHSYKSYSAPRGQLRCPGDETVDRVPCGFECPRVPVNPQDKKILLKNWRNREEIVCNYMENHGESWRSEGSQEDAINCHHHSVCNLGIFLSDLEKFECEANDALYGISYAHDWGCLNLQHET